MMGRREVTLKKVKQCVFEAIVYSADLHLNVFCVLDTVPTSGEFFFFRHIHNQSAYCNLVEVKVLNLKSMPDL